MRNIDLSQTFGGEMPVYPGDPLPEITQITNIAEHGYTDFQLKTGMHVGTHIDAPFHFIEGGKRISDISIDRFIGKAHLIDARGKNSIEPDILENIPIETDSVLLILTGHDQFFGQKNYYLDYPVLSDAFAKRVVELGVKIVGLDTPSPDRAPFSVHKILLKKDILIIENLTHLQSLLGQSTIEVMAIPPKLALEAAPVRVVARVE